MLDDIIHQCYFWEPNLTNQPKKPEEQSKYVALYPVCFARTSPQARGRGWFWLYECSVCGGERVMSQGSITYNACTCKRHHKTSDYPTETEAVCQHCLKTFTFTQKTRLHEVKYCSKECQNEGRRQAKKEWTESHQNLKPLHLFDRTIICMRKDSKNHNLCDNYHKCQSFRVFKNDLGPFYKEDLSCYVYTGINQE